MSKKFKDKNEASDAELQQSPEREKETGPKRFIHRLRDQLDSFFGRASSGNQSDENPSETQESEKDDIAQIEDDSSALDKVYKYFEENFCLSREELDRVNPEIAKRIALIRPGSGNAYFYELLLKNITSEDEQIEVSDYLKFIYFNKQTNEISPATYNAIFILGGDATALKLLDVSLSSCLKEHGVSCLDREKKEFVILDILKSIKERRKEKICLKDLYLKNETVQDAIRQQAQIEVDSATLDKVYKYFEENFCLSREDIDKINPKIAKKIALIRPGSGNAYFYDLLLENTKTENAESEALEFLKFIYYNQKTNEISPAAYNAIFILSGDATVYKLLDVSVSNYLRQYHILDLDREKKDYVIQCIFKYIKEGRNEKICLRDRYEMHGTIGDAISFAEIESEKERNPDKKTKREEAVKAVDRKCQLKMLRKNDLALTDDQMSTFFTEKKSEPGSNPFYSTYFNSSEFGLAINGYREIENHIIKVTYRKKYPRFIQHSKQVILEALEPAKASERFTTKMDSDGKISANLFFTESGTKAAKLFINHFIKKDHRVLMTNQEYGDIIEAFKARFKELWSRHFLSASQNNGAPDTEINDAQIEENAKQINEFAKQIEEQVEKAVIRLDEEYTGDDDAYEKQIEAKLLKEGKVDFIFASDYSRLGTQFPLKRLRKICSRHNIKLIVDSCQTIGRKAVGKKDEGYDEVDPDVIIASCQKGYEIPYEAAGFLVVSDSLLKECDDVTRASYINDGKEEDNGSMDTGRVLAAKIACAPNELSYLKFEPKITEKLPEGLLEVITHTIEERHIAIGALAYNFADLVQQINKNHEGRIKIHNPSEDAIYNDDGSINEKNLTCTFECEIEGMTRAKVIEIAESYGVVIGDLYGGTNPDRSFRITFHPYMNNDAIKILVHVLMECSEIARKDESSNKENKTGSVIHVHEHQDLAEDERGLVTSILSEEGKKRAA